MADQVISTARPVMHTFSKEKKEVSVGKALAVLLLSAALGVASGWAFVSVTKKGEVFVPAPSTKEGVSVGQTYGSADERTFSDTTEGVLQEGGINGEGQYHVERKGGENQNVYVTSSVVDLSLFVGRKVKVWGETFAGEKAGWLMDVGKVKVLE